MRWLITGSAGFVGRHLLKAIDRRGFDDVWAIDKKAVKSPDADVTFIQSLEDWINTYGKDSPKFDVVVHLAANIAPLDQRMNGSFTAYQDIALDMAMANWIASHQPSKAFVYMSSCSVDNPEDPYAWVKLTGERFCMRLRDLDVPVVILRPFSGYGADQDEGYPFPAILKRVLRGDDPVEVWGTGLQIRDWIHVHDLARAILWAVEKAPRGYPIEIGTGRGNTITGLARMMMELSGNMAELKYLVEKPCSSLQRIANTKLAKQYGFETSISLEEGIVRAIEEMRGVAPARA